MNVFPTAIPETTEVIPNRGTLSVMEELAQEVPRDNPDARVLGGEGSGLLSLSSRGQGSGEREPRLLHLMGRDGGKRGPRLQGPGPKPRATPMSASDCHLQQPEWEPSPPDHVV